MTKEEKYFYKQAKEALQCKRHVCDWHFSYLGTYAETSNDLVKDWYYTGFLKTYPLTKLDNNGRGIVFVISNPFSGKDNEKVSERTISDELWFKKFNKGHKPKMMIQFRSQPENCTMGQINVSDLIDPFRAMDFSMCDCLNDVCVLMEQVGCSILGKITQSTTTASICNNIWYEFLRKFYPYSTDVQSVF